MRVYRIEFPNPDGSGYIGPYSYPFRHRKGSLSYLLSELDYNHSYTTYSKHPAIPVPDGCSVGVRSMKDLFRWFGGFLPPLLRHGARIGVYEVDEDHIEEEDEYQVAFVRAHAKDVTPEKENDND